MRGHDIVVVGASAGGLQAVRTIVRGLDHRLPAAVFLVIHTSPTSESFLADVLGRAGRLYCVQASDGELIRHGRVYIAPPDHHLLLTKDRVRVTRGPRENLSRPAVDPLFRTAARFHGPSVLGVVLSGLLGDGAAGLAEIKRCGGVAIVQDPAGALYPDMPLSALREAKVDHCLGLEAIPALINRLTRARAKRRKICEAGPDVQLLPAEPEPPDAARKNAAFDGKPAGFSCPECMGPIWEVEMNGVPRYTCQVGHAFSLKDFELGQDQLVERALWTALSALQDKAALARRTEQRMNAAGFRGLARAQRRKASEAQREADLIRGALLGRGRRKPRES